MYHFFVLTLLASSIYDTLQFEKVDCKPQFSNKYTTAKGFFVISQRKQKVTDLVFIG